MSGEGEERAGYTNVHRAFLQALLSRQTITYPEAKPLLAAIETAATPARPTLVEDVSQQDFDNYIHTLNEHISPFDLEIRSTRHQATKLQVYALVNTTSDALTQMATLRTADEMAFVKRVLDAMFETNNSARAEVMAVNSMQAVKLAKAPNDSAARRESGAGGQTQRAGQAASAGLTLAQAERVLADLVSEGWLELSAKGYYTLTPRALMELRGWLIDTYNEPSDEEDDEDDEEPRERIKFCKACKEIVSMGQRCPTLTCPARLHDGCVRNMFRAQGGNEQCPVCKTAWTDAPPVGEKAARNGGDGRRASTNGNAAARRRSGGATSAVPDDADDSSDTSV